MAPKSSNAKSKRNTRSTPQAAEQEPEMTKGAACGAQQSELSILKWSHASE